LLQALGEPIRVPRRDFVKSLAAGAALGSGATEGAPARGFPHVSMGTTHNAAVIGAGVFGAWTAYHLQRSGKKVVLVDAYGPSNSRASSGGESRIIRMGYGGDEIYTRWAMRALTLWRDFFHQVGEPLFHRTGVLWMAREGYRYAQETLTTLRKLGVNHQLLSRQQLEKLYPQISFGEVTWGILEPDSGALMARRAVQAVVSETLKHGASYPDFHARKRIFHLFGRQGVCFQRGLA
jgi:sarcosine oxidase